MDFFKDIYNKVVKEVVFDTEYDLNYTCNVLLSKNMTLIEIDRGWEGIPESLVIQLILCSFMILPFVIFRYLARYRSNIEVQTNKKNWIEFIYGNRDIKKKPIVTKDIQSIESQIPIGLRPIHKQQCKNQKKKHSYGSSSTTIVHHNLSPSSSSSSTTSSNCSTISRNKCDTSSIKIENDGDDGNGISTVEMNGSKSNLVQQHETTFFPSGRHISTYFHLTKHPIDSLHSIFTKLLNISDDDILKNKGHDAYQYLLFQRYVILFLFVLTLVTTLIILPININGSSEGKAFARTSISNISNESGFYWAHAICSTFIIFVGVLLMNRFSSQLKTDDDLMYCKTLLFRRIPIIENLEHKFDRYFAEEFPQIQIKGYQFITDVLQLDFLEQSYKNAVKALKYCENINLKINPDSGDKRFMIRPYNCSRLACCACCNEMDGEEFYLNEMKLIETEICNELRNIPSKPFRSAFVTFKTEQMAMEVYKFIKNKQKHRCFNCFRIFYESNSFDPTSCVVSFAPYPDDVNWRDIAFDMNLLWLRKIVISIILFVIFFFLSTPAFLLKIFDLITTKELINKGIIKSNSIITDFLSPFLLMLLAIILPSIVYYACLMTPYKKISDLNHAVMSNVYAFLVMMIIVLPSTGFLSINAMLGAVLMPSPEQQKFRWHCLFPVDNGAFFVIYTLQAAILGNVAEILRIPELVLYVVYTLFLRSPAEYEKARKWVTFDFPFGVSYPRFLLIFTMTVIYSFACPLIAPCGLLYMIGKHIVDRYNIYHVYQPTKINRRIHSSAILYVHVGLILMQFQLFSAIIIKTQYSHVTLFVLIVLIITILTFAFYFSHHWFRNLIRITGSINTRKYNHKRDFCVCSFTPPVLYNLMDDGLIPMKENPA